MGSETELGGASERATALPPQPRIRRAAFRRGASGMELDGASGADISGGRPGRGRAKRWQCASGAAAWAGPMP